MLMGGLEIFRKRYHMLSLTLANNTLKHLFEICSNILYIQNGMS